MAGTWFNEKLHVSVAQRLLQGEVLLHEKTDVQDLIIFKNPVLGRVLALDGVVQVAEADEFVYHEMLTHVPIYAHGAVKRVLVIGGGDGGIIRRCLEHKNVESVTLVEIDRSVVDLSQTYLPSISAGAFSDPRCHLVIADGCVFVKESTDRFDVIIVDSTDPQGPGEVLFRQEFYQDCKRCLAPGGILVTQNGVPFLQPEELRTSYQRLSSLFADVSFFIAAVPTYYGGSMAFGWATDNPALRTLDTATVQARFDQSPVPTRFYTPSVHVASFALPRFMEDLLSRSA
jgi:spermidine synthase